MSGEGWSPEGEGGAIGRALGRRRVVGDKYQEHTLHSSFNSTIPSILLNSPPFSLIHGGPLRLYRARSSGRSHAETDVIVRAGHSDWLRPFTWSAFLGWVSARRRNSPSTWVQNVRDTSRMSGLGQMDGGAA